MKNVQKIIEAAGRKLDGSDQFWHIKVTVPGSASMDLVIEGIGLTPDGRQQVSVAHYYEQNGDLMRDPEIVFLVDPQLADIQGAQKGWFPMSYTQDSLGLYHEALWWNEKGQMMKRCDLEKSIHSLAFNWNKNLRDYAKSGKAVARDV